MSSLNVFGRIAGNGDVVAGTGFRVDFTSSDEPGDKYRRYLITFDGDGSFPGDPIVVITPVGQAKYAAVTASTPSSVTIETFDFSADGTFRWLPNSCEFSFMAMVPLA